VGSHGTVLVTIDGGAHWSQQDSGTTNILEAVACPDAGHAWVGGFPLDDGKPTLLHTTDGGGTWASLNGWLNAGVYGIACADATHAWAVGTNGIVLAWDTVGPVTRAAATSGRRGHAIVLHYEVTDKLSVVAMAVRVVVRNSRSKTVRSFSLGARKIAYWQRVSWVPGTRGTYHYYVYAKDLAGNTQSKHGLAKVVVR